MFTSTARRWRTAAAIAATATVLAACSGGGANDVAGAGKKDAETTLNLVA